MSRSKSEDKSAEQKPEVREPVVVQCEVKEESNPEPPASEPVSETEQSKETENPDSEMEPGETN